MSIIDGLPNIFGFDVQNADQNGVQLAIFKQRSKGEIAQACIERIASPILAGAGTGAAVGLTLGGAGAIAGVAVGGSVSIAAVVTPIAVGTIIGGIVGGGAVLITQYPAEKRALLNQTQIISEGMLQYRETIRSALELLCEQEIHDEELATGLEINCPITLNLMCLPIKVDCGHVFEAAAIYAAINTPTGHLCPMCRNPIDKANFRFHNATSIAVIKVAGRIFQNLEKVLNRLPNNLLSSGKNFVDREVTERLSAAIRSGELILEDGPALLAKLNNPENLTFEEACAVAFYIAQQFKPILFMIRQTRKLGIDALEELYESGNITRVECDQKGKELQEWSDRLQEKIIPSDICPIVKKISALKNK